MIDFYGSPMSSSGRSHWMLEEVGVAYAYHRVNLRDPASSGPFEQINPGGKIPFLIDGDLRLAESIAINCYLAERYAPALWGTDVAERARLLQWSLWAITNLQPAAIEVMYYGMLLPLEKRDPDRVATGKRTSQRLIDHLEAAMTGAFLVGDRFTVADVNAGSTVNLALRGNAATAGPKVTAWIDALRLRPAYVTAAAAG